MAKDRKTLVKILRVKNVPINKLSSKTYPEGFQGKIDDKVLAKWTEGKDYEIIITEEVALERLTEAMQAEHDSSKAPLKAEDFESLEDDELRELCERFDIKPGRKARQTLIKELMDYEAKS